VAKIQYLAKRVRPECLTAVSFLSTRVQCCDTDDLAKLDRLLGYIYGTRNRGIVLSIGEYMTISAYIDAAYGVHTASGKSHTGCAIVVGEVGPVFCKSGKQKIVTKSSTEAELVGLSSTATEAIHLRNFVIAQGYEVGPAIVYQDNMSCMALMKRGRPASERSRHISIRHFWLAERVANGEILIEHLRTDKMFANVLTKPVQGAQFVKEREGLTGWSKA
jgi:exosome complex RNA-binding protein Rrp4